MGLEECISRVIREIEKRDDLGEGIKRQFVESLRDINNDARMSPEQKRARMLAMNNEHRKELHHAQVVKVLEEQKRIEIEDWLSQFPETERATRLREWIERSSDYISQDTKSVSHKIRQIEAQAASRLNNVWRAITDRRLPWMQDDDFADTFVRELAGQDTGSQRAKELVKEFRDVTKEMIQRAREAGVYVGEIDNWAPQNTSVSKIQQDMDAWRNYLIENLDPEYHPDPDSTVDHVFRTLTTRHLEEPDMATISMSRKLKFRTPEAQIEYFMRFGDQSVSQALFQNVRALSRKAALAEEVGPTTAVVKNKSRELAKNAAEKAQAARARGDKKLARQLEADERHAARTEWVLDSTAGAFANPTNVKTAQWMGAARQWMVTQFLGFVASLLATQDSLISMFGARFHTGGFASGVTEQVRNIATIAGSREARRWAEEMGFWQHALFHAATDRFATPFAASERARGIAGQTATATQRMTGTYALESALRSASAMTISRSLGRHLPTPWNEIHPRYRRVLEANGFTEGRWKQLQERMPIREDLGTVEVDNLPRDLRDIVDSFIRRETELSVVYPDHYDRALLTLGGQAGSAPGELAATATQFWSWPIAFMRGPMRREMAMGGSGFVGFMAGMMAAGAVSTQAYAIMKDEPTFEWDSGTLWARSAMRSGLLTPVGELAMQNIMYDRIDMGPLGAQFDAVSNLVGMAGIRTIEGQAEDAARPLAQFARDIAVPNMWWMEYSLTSRAMDHIMWELDPQYMRDRERRWRREGRNM